jgi:hypothetical protein
VPEAHFRTNLTIHVTCVHASRGDLPVLEMFRAPTSLNTEAPLVLLTDTAQVALPGSVSRVLLAGTTTVFATSHLIKRTTA